MATTYLTPGVYFRRAEPAAPLPALRTDVAGFVGLAERGPLGAARRLRTFREFQQTYGGFLPYANLAYAVRGFFENGGDACWVVRVADAATACAAQATVPARAAAKSAEGAGRPAFCLAASSPGTWGNRLRVVLELDHLATTQDIVAPLVELAERRLTVRSLVGFEPGTWIRLTGHPAETRPDATPLVARVRAIDPVLSLLLFDGEVDWRGAGIRPRESVRLRIESLEFRLTVWLDDQFQERFAGLAPDPIHSRFAIPLIETGSQLVRLRRERKDWFLSLPASVVFAGGRSGLRKLDLNDCTGTPGVDTYGLAALENVDEVAILAMPDLTVRPRAPEPIRRPRLPEEDVCRRNEPLTPVCLTGILTDAETGASLVGAQVAVDGRACCQTTPCGYTLPDLIPGTHDLIFCLAGYETLTRSVTVSSGYNRPQDFSLAPLDLPPAFSPETIALGQAAMIAQCRERRDRFALLDPPLAPEAWFSPEADPCGPLCETCPQPDRTQDRAIARGGQLDLNDLRAWRSRFDTDYAALYYPWLVVSDPLAPDAPLGRLVPPCGHVAGVYAATDRAEGVFRAPANRPLAWADDVAVEIDDALHGVLNPAGINAIRSFPGRGLRIFGARTMSSESAKRFVNVRRLLNFLIESMEDGLQWAVFEPNDRQLRLGVRLSLLTLLDGLWRRGAFVGGTADAAYRVRCDATTTPPAIAALGRLIAEVEAAPVVPYEFVVLRLGVSADELRVSEV